MCLELVAQSELHYASVRGGRELTKVRRLREVERQGGEVHVVEGVERFGTELERVTFKRHLEALAERDVKVGRTSATDDAALAGRTGILIYVSVAERYAEIIADTGIDAKVEKGTWQAIVDDLTANISDGKAGDGFVHAVERSGDLLARHFPPGTRDPNELPNHLIIIE